MESLWIILLTVFLLVGGCSEGEKNTGITSNLMDGASLHEKPEQQQEDAPLSSLVSNIAAVCRSGQVFVTWGENAENTSDLKVYMSDQPITAATIASTTLLTDRHKAHSANDWFEDSEECPKASGPIRGWIIEEGAPPLARKGGLFVHTVTASDPANLYFAVLGDSQDGSDLQSDLNSTAASVAVATAPIEAIWQSTGTSPTASGKPLAILLHSHQGRPSGSLTHLVFGDASMGWQEGLPIKFKVSVLSNMVVLEPYDRVWINRRLGASETYIAYNTLYKNIESWHYGMNDKIYDPVLRLTGTPANYTERIMLWMLDWVQAQYQTDPQKVYAFGASMGTGVQRLVMKNPERFASVDLLVPLVDFAYEEGAESNAKRLEACCGNVDLVCSDGVPLRDRLDLVDFMETEMGDLPHVTIRVGRQDGSVYWKRKPPYMYAMQQNRHGLIAGWDNGTHSSAMRYSITAFPNFTDYNWHIQHFALNKSYPAFTNFSLDENPGNGDKTDGDIVGFMNRGLDWNSIVDMAARYEVKVFSTHPDTVFPVAVDITPRRRQLFMPGSGSTVNVSNIDGSGSTIDTKMLTVDMHGRITYEGFEITSSAGNTLVLELPEDSS